MEYHTGYKNSIVRLIEFLYEKDQLLTDDTSNISRKPT